MGKVPIAAMTAAESGLLGVAAIARQDNDRWLARRSQ
jgi:hypothetical protein